MSSWSPVSYTHLDVYKRQEYEYVELLFSRQYEHRGDLFEGLNIWSDLKYRNIQGLSLIHIFLPAIIMFLVFVIVPFIQGFPMSLSLIHI